MRAIIPAALFAALLANHSASAQDAVRGKHLYHDIGRLTGAGVSCIDCHGGIPGALHGLERAAGDPKHLAYALSSIEQMTPLRGRLSPEEMGDIAAYIARPRVPSPEPQLSTSGKAANAYSSERLEFALAPADTPSVPSTIRLTNRGAVALQILTAPTLSGPDAAQFVIAASDCVAGMILATEQSCAIEVVFRPHGPAGLRTASVGLAHDWIGGGFRVALIGRAM